MIYWLDCAGVQSHGVTLDLGCARMFSTATFKTYISYHHAIWIGATYYYIYFYLNVLYILTGLLQ